MGRTAALLCLVASRLLTLARSQAPLEPTDGRVYFGVWPDVSQGGDDTPLALNQRLGRNVSVYQLAQTIPVTKFSWVTGHGGEINETLIELTGTQAAIFLTVYPTQLDDIQPRDYELLGRQILGYQSPPANRSVFLRFAPEMQGDWMTYGVQPTRFVSVWREMYGAIKAIAPNTAIVWAPNPSLGYPYGMRYGGVTLTVDQLALDTNRNGRLESNDDAYSPYYPGDQYVDWCGLSWYWKGTDYPYVDNQIQPLGFTDGGLTGQAPPGALGNGPTRWTPFYDTYCTRKNKPCMFAEMGAAYHRNASGTGASQLDIQQAWWQNTITNSSFLDSYPQIKLVMLFEHEKLEDQADLRDFRITRETLPDFLRDLQGAPLRSNKPVAPLTLGAGVADRYIWAPTATVPDSAIASANGQVGPGAYTGRLSDGMPVQTLSPNVFIGGGGRTSTVAATSSAWLAAAAVGAWTLMSRL